MPNITSTFSPNTLEQATSAMKKVWIAIGLLGGFAVLLLILVIIALVVAYRNKKVLDEEFPATGTRRVY